MTNTDLKNNLHKQIDLLDEDKLEEVNGIILNYINSNENAEEWSKLTSYEQQGIINALNQIDDGIMVSHEDVISNAKERIINAS